MNNEETLLPQEKKITSEDSQAEEAQDASESKEQAVEDVIDEEEEGAAVAAKEQKKKSGTEEIRENVAELHEVIAYMDYSFERAFTIQEKEFMYAYAQHTKDIRRDIESLKPDPNDEAQEIKKQKKIKLFQQRLAAVREAALWLDHITEEHTKSDNQRC